MAKSIGLQCFLLSAVLGGAAFAQESSTSSSRRVVVNLFVDQPQSNETVQLRTSGGDVLAQVAKPDKLKFEVVISGPLGNVPVLFDVPKESEVYKSFEQDGQSNPDQVLQTLLSTVGDPNVRIVARRLPRYSDQYRGTCRKYRLTFNDPWKPFYEVSLPAANSRPVYVPIPEADEQIWDMMNRALENDQPRQYVKELMRISGKG